MKWIFLVLLVLALIFLYYGVSIYAKYQVSKKLIAQAKPFELVTNDETKPLLVLGDSTAVGVGASKPEDTLAALVAHRIGATEVENYGASGARVADLAGQIQKAKLKHYALILVQIGANDIVRFKSIDDAADELTLALQQLPHAEKVVVMSAGNVGGTKFFPFFVNPIYTQLNLTYHDGFEAVVKNAGGVYVNLYQDPSTDPFVQEPDIYLAKDGFHPTSAGYKLWFEEIIEKAAL